MMTRENRAAVVIVAAAAILVALTAFFGTQSRSKSLTPESVAGKTYLAPNGKSRPDARPFFSRSRRHDDAETRAVRAPASETPRPIVPPEQVQRPEPDLSPSIPAVNPPDPPSEVKRVVEEAFNALSPEQGIESLNKAIPSLTSAAEASRLYAARGRLLMQQTQPNLDRAFADVAEAKRLAQDPYDAHYAARTEAELLMSQGESARAAACIQQALTQYPAPTLPGLELRLILAGIREDEGDTAAAEATYLQTMDESLASSEALGNHAVDQYRLAAIRLARLFRKTGRAKDAETLAETVKQRLSQ